MAERITAAQFNECIPARDALSLVCDATSHWETAVVQIIDRAIAGLLQAYAEHAQESHMGDTPREHDLFHITPSIWANGTTGQFAGDLSLWRSNDMAMRFVLQGPRPQVCSFKFFGIRFDRQGIQKMLGRQTNMPAAAVEPVPAHSEKGGRPRKAFWDDLWLAMFERIWLDNFQPKTQSEIESAMLDWATSKGHDLGPTCVKTPARKLLNLIQKS